MSVLKENYNYISCPRVLLAAPKSGSGKTTVTCGLIRALQRRGKTVASLKCGPDYIDPMFHRQVAGISSGNLDTYFADDSVNRRLLLKQARKADITVLEGVMGYYDGLGGASEEASTYHAARVTNTPVVLVADAKGASVTLAALIKGMLDFRADSNIQGVILNRVSGAYYERIKCVIERETGVRVLGYLPDMQELKLPSRHLGLVAPEEIEALDIWIEKASAVMEEYIDIDGIIRIAQRAAALRSDENTLDSSLPRFSRDIRLAVARDEAFSFYYKENLELLTLMGAELVEFSPLSDDRLPENIDGIILGGGYPELYAGRLSANESMRADILQAAKSGIAVVAECGGFMYLMKELEGADGRVYPMVGLFDGKAFNAGKLSRFGYVEISGEGFMSDEGTAKGIKGHEFHRWDTTDNGADLLAIKPVSGVKYECMHMTDKLLAGYPHLYYYSNIEAVYKFYEGACGQA